MQACPEPQGYRSSKLCQQAATTNNSPSYAQPPQQQSAAAVASQVEKPLGSAAPLAAALDVANSSGDAGDPEAAAAAEAEAGATAAAVGVGSMHWAGVLNLPKATSKQEELLAAVGLTKPREISWYLYSNCGPEGMLSLLVCRLCALFPAVQNAHTKMFRALGNLRDQMSQNNRERFLETVLGKRDSPTAAPWPGPSDLQPIKELGYIAREFQHGDVSRIDWDCSSPHAAAFALQACCRGCVESY